MAQKDRGLLSQYSSNMSGLPRSQVRMRLIAALAALAVPFFIWSLWSLEVVRSPNAPEVQPHITPPVDPGLQPFKDSRPRPSLNNAPASSSSAGPPATESIPAEMLHDIATASSSSVAISVPTTIPTTDRPLILYAYFETELARINLKFYIAHALHGAADFVFIFNGETDADQLLPKGDNIKSLHRENDCYDLGAFAEVLLKDDLYKKYTRYILMNASLRGPFLPVWARGECWSDMYLGLLSEEVKLVGMTMNCMFQNHIQSMLWALDRPGLEALLFPTNESVVALEALLAKRPMPENSLVPPMKTPGINSCPHEYWEAVAIEVYATSMIRASGYEVSAMMSAYHSQSQDKYEAICEMNGDVYWPPEGGYWGMDIHPFDTLFAKTNRGIAPKVLQLLTEWMDGDGYSSYDFCR